jgi:LacI family transcriptional regulator
MNERIVKSTIHDIARELNVTASTVSRALNNHPSISNSTKQAVERTAKKLNYQPNRIASSLRLGKSNIIGVIIPSTEINFFGSVIHGIEKIASENDYTVLIYQSNELADFEKKGVETFLRSRVDGVIASLSKETRNFDHYIELKRRGVPLVLFDRANDELNVPSVVVQDFEASFLATQHLVEQGCRRIAYIGGQQHVAIFNQRLRGYVHALKENNFAVDEDLILFGKVSIESGRECMKRLLSLPEIPDAVVAVEDFTALGAIQSIKAANKKIPGDIAIIGFANAAFGNFITPTLSTVDQQATKMGEEAAKLFFEMICSENGKVPSSYKLILKPVLILRESSIKDRQIL